MTKEEFDADYLEALRNEDVTVFERFEEFQKSSINAYTKIEWTHEFLDLLSFKLRESRCKMDKEFLAQYILSFFRKTIKNYDYNSKFVGSQIKSLVTYYRNRRELDKAIESLEFLIQNGIVDDDGQGFHIQLDDLYRLRQKRAEKQGN